MKNLILMALFLISCSTFHRSENHLREIASTKLQDSPLFDLKLSSEIVFANGVNSVVLKVQIKDELVNPADLKLISDISVGSSKFTSANGFYLVTITPKIKSPNIKLKVIWKDKPSQVIELRTTLAPLTDKMIPLKAAYNSATWLSGLYYRRQELLPEGQYEAFMLANRGKNVIVNAEDSSRDYEFEFDELARQNISMMISDSPNGTVSHTMHSHFMFFPRKYLPHAEVNKKEVTVTLPTGEHVVFAESGEIIDGVFEEGPVDIGPDRFKRTYADLKYQGKGILLRANARGQMPQQGQFESAKIDMEYGIKNSAEVLIINGTTGQRCRRPKIDFWLPDDVSPILFKFPTDAEFDVYLKANCHFGIPELENKQNTEKEEENSSELSTDIWNKCKGDSEIKSCLDMESDRIENATTKSKVKFDLELIYLKAKEAEQFGLAEVLQREVNSIRASLLAEASWMKQQSCLEKSKSLIKSSFKFHDMLQLIQDKLIKNCSTITDEMDKIAATEVAPLQKKLEENFEWANVTTTERFISDCQKQALTLISSKHRYYLTPDLYAPSLKSICVSVESSEAYKTWLQTQGAGLEDKIFTQLLIDVEARGEKQAQSCLKSYPVDTQLNRVKYKTQRENCLIDNWFALEAEALKTAKEDPLVKRVGLSFDSINTRIAMERRRLQLRVMKKYFL
jgi:hypothetical protein